MSRKARPPVILVMGPTATGKTDLAVALHRALPVDVISVDSALVYRGMDIGTAKPAPGVLAECPHQLIDVCDPAERYSAGRFLDDATAAIRRSVSAGRIPLLVGGTMLYFRVLQEGIAELPQGDPALRAEIDDEAETSGWPALHAELERVDPVAAARIEPYDAQRIQRALEVYRLTGSTITQLREATPPHDIPWRFLKVGLWPTDRESLHRRIEERFRKMMALGLVDEVRRLRARGDLTPDLPSMRAVGYRQVWAYLDGRYDAEEMVRRAVVATRQLAKRQLTWLRAERGLYRIDVPCADIDSVCLSWLAAEIGGSD